MQSSRAILSSPSRLSKASIPALLLVTLVCTTALANDSGGECREFDRVSYSELGGLKEAAVDLDALPGIRLGDIEEPGKSTTSAELERHRSPQATASFVKSAPDTSRPGPWSTSIHVYGNQARPLGLKVEILDHSSYGVRANWINEHLLYIQVWRGRIVAVDLILDVEQRTFLYAREANYGTLIMPCTEKRSLASAGDASEQGALAQGASEPGEMFAIGPASARPDDQIPQWVREAFEDDDGRPLRSVAVDLGGGPGPEKLIPNDLLCGNGGCPWLVYNADDDRIIGRFFAATLTILEETACGYRVLRARSHVGSGQSEVVDHPLCE